MGRWFAALAVVAIAVGALTGCASQRCDPSASPAPAEVPEGVGPIYPLGTPIVTGEWRIVVNSVTTCADALVKRASDLNREPDSGEEYIVVSLTVTYLGSDRLGRIPSWTHMHYVRPGYFVSHTNAIVDPPPSLAPFPLRPGESTTGNVALIVPSPVDGVLSFKPGPYPTETYYSAVR